MNKTKHYITRIFWTFLLSISAVCAQEKNYFEQTANVLLTQYAQTISLEVRHGWSNAHKVWPGAKLDDVIFLFATDKKGWAISVEGMEPISEEKIASFYKRSSFAFVTFREQKAVFINARRQRDFFLAIAEHGLPEGIDVDLFTGGVSYDLSSVRKALRAHNEANAYRRIPTKETGSTTAFGTGTHESFHHYIQSEVGIKNEDIKKSDRAADWYPAPVIPRALRGLLTGALREAYRNKKERLHLLAAAAYWNEEWKTQFPEDYAELAYTDIVEGTAEYFEVAVAALTYAAFKKPLADDDVSLTAIGNVGMKTSTSAGYSATILPSAQRESYNLGAISGLLADKLKLPWRAEVVKGMRPVEALLKGIEPVEQPFPDSVLKSAKSIFQHKDKRSSRGADSFIQRFTKPNDDDLFVVLNGADSEGSISANSMIRSLDLPKSFILWLELKAEFTLNTGNAEINRVTIVRITESFCGKKFINLHPVYLLALKDDDVQISEGRIRIEKANLKIDVSEEGSSRREIEGRNVLCLK